MVTGGEYVFENIDKALAYVLEYEKKALAEDVYRREPPMVVRHSDMLFMQPAMSVPYVPVDSLDYPYTAYFNQAAETKFLMTRLYSGRYSLKPNLRNRKFLFRGQTAFHQPCKPNLFRCSRQKRFTAEMVRGQEMKLLMLSHPLVQLLDMGVELGGKTYQFEMNLSGLTQHYYNKTVFLDLTSDPQVAAFFAVTQCDEATDTYTPIVDENHAPGVLYYYSLNIQDDFGRRQDDGRKSPLSTIGLQVFPRSGRQKGFLYGLQKEENFNDIPRLNAVFFRHNADIARRICDHFDNGRILFPDDMLTRHWRERHPDKNVISKRTVLMNKIDNPQMTMPEVEAEIKSLGLDVQDYVPAFTAEELDEYYDAVWNKYFWTNLCQQIHIPGDKDGRMMNDLLNLPYNPKYRWAFVPDNSHVTDYSKGYIMKDYQECLRR